MRGLTLLRVTENIWGTPGVLFENPDFMVTTMERGWADNHPDTSCIPVGKYSGKRINSPHFGNTFQLAVDGRDNILLHKGNWQTDSKGCILVGSGFALLNGQEAITGAGDGFAHFLEYLKADNEFELTIKNAF